MIICFAQIRSRVSLVRVLGHIFVFYKLSNYIDNLCVSCNSSPQGKHTVKKPVPKKAMPKKPVQHMLESPKSKRNRVPLNSSEKLKVLEIYNKINDNWIGPYPPQSTIIVNKTAETAGISRNTVYRILKEYHERKEVKSPPPKKPRTSKFDELDERTLAGIRCKVHNFYFETKIPTLDKVLVEVNADETLPNFSRTSLYRILKRKLKFRYALWKTKSMLVDKDEIVIWRVNYLQEIRKIRNEFKRIYFIDETWIDEGPHHKDCLSTNWKAASGNEKRLIIVHIVSNEGYVAGGEFIYEAKVTEDYSEIDAHTFETWFKKILTKMEKGSVVVLDNAPYHSRMLEQVPTPLTKKTDIQNWLREKKIPFDTSEVRALLLERVNLIKHKYQTHVIDEMAKEKGITVLRLPPFHNELNPIELIWAEIKKYFSENKIFTLTEIKSLLPEALGSISSEIWQNCMRHVEEEEIRMSRLDGIVDDMVEEFVLGESSKEQIGDYDSSEDSTND